MKYMGSKRYMLKNGLGELILRQGGKADRIVDLFCGGASVSWFAASNLRVPVLACDLQTYASVLAAAVVERTEPLETSKLGGTWLAAVEKKRKNLAQCRRAFLLDSDFGNIERCVYQARELCASTGHIGSICAAYGGYYFGPIQALTFDLLLRELPRKQPERSACLAALISAASACAASPGHTAQPLRPNQRAATYISEAWQRDPIQYVRVALNKISPQYAHTRGSSIIADAISVATRLKPTDLVIVDPPYSDVQYSRFYHVLESIARGGCRKVEGAGRYPPRQERPQSDFSKKSKSKEALSDLLAALAEVKAKVILTFPAGKCSNGLTGEIVIGMASEYFRVERKDIYGQFSTLGGFEGGRAARQISQELLLMLEPM